MKLINYIVLTSIIFTHVSFTMERDEDDALRQAIEISLFEEQQRAELARVEQEKIDRTIARVLQDEQGTTNYHESNVAPSAPYSSDENEYIPSAPYEDEAITNARPEAIAPEDLDYVIALSLQEEEEHKRAQEKRKQQDYEFAKQLQEQEKKQSVRRPARRNNERNNRTQQSNNNARVSHQLYAGRTIPLPRSLQNKNIMHIPVCRRSLSSRRDTCSYMALFNAKAIQEILMNRQPITSEKIKQKAIKYDHFIDDNNIGHGLRTDVTAALGQQLHLSNLYILMDNRELRTRRGKIMNLKNAPGGGDIICTKDGSIKYHYQNGQITSVENNFSTVINHINNNDTICVHFICCINQTSTPHAVLATVIKQLGQQPLIIYADNNDTPIKEGSDAYRYLMHLWNNIR